MITHQEMIISRLEQAASQGLTKEDVIKDFVDEHMMLISKIKEGERYYYAENDVLDKKVFRYETEYDSDMIPVNHKKVEADEKSNNRYPHAWHKLLVDQKTQYLFGKPISISVKEEAPEQFEKDINSLFKDLSDDLNEVSESVSNAGRSFIHPYIKNINDDTNKVEFSYVEIPYTEMIPIYDTTFNRNLVAGIRHYNILDNGKEVTRVEFWEADGITYYKLESGILKLDTDMEVNPEPYYYKDGEPYTWASGIPLIEFYNNKKKTSDLVFYKGLIDAFDNNMNKLIDNVEDVQEIIMAISGADGTPPDELRANLNFHKIVKTTEGQDVKAIQIEVPYETRKYIAEQLSQNIFLFGQGIDFTKDKFGNDKSGVALSFLYGLLEQKASKTERAFNKALNKLMSFGTEYINLSENTDYDADDVLVKLNKLKITSDKSRVEMIKNSETLLSTKTRLEAHPLVEDVEEELSRIENEGISGGLSD